VCRACMQSTAVIPTLSDAQTQCPDRALCSFHVVRANREEAGRDPLDLASAVEIRGLVGRRLFLAKRAQHKEAKSSRA
jgi:hypothetical protein